MQPCFHNDDDLTILINDVSYYEVAWRLEFIILSKKILFCQNKTTNKTKCQSIVLGKAKSLKVMILKIIFQSLSITMLA